MKEDLIAQAKAIEERVSRYSPKTGALVRIGILSASHAGCDAQGECIISDLRNIAAEEIRKADVYLEDLKAFQALLGRCGGP